MARLTEAERAARIGYGLDDAEFNRRAAIALRPLLRERGAPLGLRNGHVRDWVRSMVLMIEGGKRLKLLHQEIFYNHVYRLRGHITDEFVVRLATQRRMGGDDFQLAPRRGE